MCMTNPKSFGEKPGFQILAATHQGRSAKEWQRAEKVAFQEISEGQQSTAGALFPLQSLSCHGSPGMGFRAWGFPYRLYRSICIM